jgi:hypothetical protein
LTSGLHTGLTSGASATILKRPWSNIFAGQRPRWDAERSPLPRHRFIQSSGCSGSHRRSLNPANLRSGGLRRVVSQLVVRQLVGIELLTQTRNNVPIPLWFHSRNNRVASSGNHGIFFPSQRALQTACSWKPAGQEPPRRRVKWPQAEISDRCRKGNPTMS